MKYLILILILISLISLNSYACEVKNDEFNFNYNIKGDYISYHIERKDKQDFKYFQRYYFNNKNTPAEFGFILKNTKKNYSLHSNNSKITNFYDIDYYYTNMLYTVPQVGDKRIELPIPSNRMKLVKEIKEYVNFKNFINSYQIQQNTSSFYQEKQVRFEIRLVLDSDLDNCLIFKTDTIDYNMGPQIYWNLKKFYAIRIFS